MTLVRSLENLVTIFAFGRPTRLLNFSPIKACVSEVEQFLHLCKKKKNKKKKEGKKTKKKS